MSDGWSKEIDRNARECQERHERNAELANDAWTKASFCERRLIALMGERGDNGIIAGLRAEVVALKAESESTKKFKFKLLGAAAIVLIALPLLSALGVMLAQRYLGGSP